MMLAICSRICSPVIWPPSSTRMLVMLMSSVALAGCGADTGNSPATTTATVPPQVKSDAVIKRDRAFYLTFDDNIVKLDDAINAAQNDQGTRDVQRIAGRLAAEYRAYRADGGDEFRGAARVVALARAATNTPYVAELAKIRRRLAAARAAFTAQVMGR